MTDQVSNALSILSYFSSLLDPISTPAAIQKQHSEKYSSKSHAEPSGRSPKSSNDSSIATETSPLNISNVSPFSIPDCFQPVMIGLKLPLTLPCTSDFQTSSMTPLSMSTSNVDHQAFFFINPVVSPTVDGERKAVSVGPSARNRVDDARQIVFSESSWSISPSSPGCSSKQSADSVKSENFFAKNSSEQDQANVQICSASSSPTWREGSEEVNFQFPGSTLSFSIPFSTIGDSKQYLNNDAPSNNFNGVAVSTDSNKVQNPNSVSPGNHPSGFNHLHSGGGAAKEEKICAVCGDRALGCNFDAVSCESCKAFFRRNAFKEQKIKCLFDGSCQINVNTRRFCSFCRLKQCFTVGMKKDLILGVEEKKRRMEVVKQNRKRRTEECESSTTTIAISTTATPSTNSTTSTDIPSNESTNLLSLAKHDPLTSSSGSSSQSIDSQLVRKLTAEESHMLIDLNQVYDLSFTVDLEPLIHITQLNPSLNQLVNQSSYTVLRLIKFAKRLDDFVKLSQDLQIGILKGCWFHLLLLRPVSLFDAERDGWITPKGVIPTDILKNATGYVQLHDDHVRYCRSIKNIIGNDIMLLVILLVLVLFAPDGPHVVAREVISNIQDRYVILLKHYLEAKYTFKRSAHMFPQLLEKIRELNSLVENHAKILMDINPQEIEPIMLEMLDFKN